MNKQDKETLKLIRANIIAGIVFMALIILIFAL